MRYGLILLAWFLTACKVDQPVDSSRIVQMIPPGTPLSEARSSLEKAGYRCELKENADFFESSKQKLHTGINYLYCDRETGIPVSTRTQAALLHKDGVVTEVLLSTGRTGP